LVVGRFQWRPPWLPRPFCSRLDVHQDDDGNWQATNTYRRDEVPAIVDLALQVYRFILQKESDAASEKREAGE